MLRERLIGIDSNRVGDQLQQGKIVVRVGVEPAGGEVKSRFFEPLLQPFNFAFAKGGRPCDLTRVVSRLDFRLCRDKVLDA